mgnify:CR=1 FL=1
MIGTVSFEPGAFDTLQAKALVRGERKELPENACPDYRRGDKFFVNPLDKNFRHVGLSPEQESEFRGICQVSADQFLDCYCDVNRPISPNMLLYMCSDCPYCFQKSPITTARIYTNMSPFFLIKTKKEEIELKNKPKSYVYLVSDGEYIKIGKATNIANRLNGIQTGNPRKCQVLAAIPCKSGNSASVLENYLHTQYAKFRREGEWFDLLGYIDIDDWNFYFDPAKCGVPSNKIYVTPKNALKGRGDKTSGK